jgi:hypothetical protein
LEVDPTSLTASKNAERSTKGCFQGFRNRRGRELRVTALQYGEVLFEKLYPGNTTSKEVLKGTMIEVERILGLNEGKRRQILI